MIINYFIVLMIMAITYPDLGKIVTQEWDKLSKSGIPIQFFMEQLAAPLDLNGANSIFGYVHHLRRGNYYGTDSNRPRNAKKGLERLAIFLYAIGFSEEDERYGGVIEGLRERAKKRGDIFAYPPPADKRVSLDEIKKRYSEQNAIAQETKDSPQETEEKPEGNKMKV